MRKLINISIDNSLLIIILAVAITFLMAFFMTGVVINPDLDALMPGNEKLDELIEKYDPGNNEKNLFLLGLELKGDLSPEALQSYFSVINDIEEAAEGFSSSIFSAVTFVKEGRRLVPRNLLTERRAPANEEELNVFMENMKKDVISKDVFYTKDYRKFNTLFFHNGQLDESFKDEYYNIIERLDPYFRTYTTGTYFLTQKSSDYLSGDLVKLLLISLLTILAFYYLGFRSKRAVLLPMVIVSFGTVWAVGFMGLAGFEITIVSIVIPPLVLTMGTSYAIHYINQYYYDAKADQNYKSWLTEASVHVNKTILMASATTLIGFLSLLLSSIEAVREFGISTSMGVMACAILSMTLLPAIMSRLKTPEPMQMDSVRNGIISRASALISNRIYKSRYVVMILFAAVIALFAFSYAGVKSQSDYTSYFPADEPVVKDLKFIMKNFSGVQRLNLTISAPEGSANYFLERENLEKIRELEKKIARYEDVTKIMSFPQLIADLNQLMTGESRLPESKGLILLLAKYSKGLSETTESGLSNIMINEDYSRINLTIMIRNSGNNTFLSEKALRDLIHLIEVDSRRTLDEELDFDLWGFDMEYLELARTVQKDQSASTALSMGIILILTSLLFKSLLLGIVTLIPLLSGLMLNTILMALFQIPLDITTMMVSSVAIGVGVDDAVHYMLQFRKQSARSDSPMEILNSCAALSGRPIILTTLSIVGGLLSLTFASFKGIVYFGALVSLTLTSTMIGTLLLLPAALGILWDFKTSKMSVAELPGS